MQKFWIANFDFEECLRYGLRRNCWLMQYQYSDADGNVFQGDRPSAVTTNWRQVKGVQVGDYLVAYLSRKRNPLVNGFFAIGRVAAPRQAAVRSGTVEDYVRNKQSHEYRKGIVHYSDAPVFYEDFNDRWRPHDDSLSRYAQRIDVEKWSVAETGVPWLAEIKVGPSEQQRAIFQITKSWFNKILNSLEQSSPSPKRRSRGRNPIKEEKAATFASEKAYSDGQGYQLDSKLRKALEVHAMKAATEYFRAQGYKVADVSAKRPYDLECVKGKAKLFVEVKGTQSLGESIFLTAGEVRYAIEHANSMALFVLHSISVDEHGSTCGGVSSVRQPWILDHEDLAPLSYKYRTVV